MRASTKRVMYYHADASPVGGHITHPMEHHLRGDGSVSLSQAGGHMHARVEEYKLEGLVDCGAVYSKVHGTHRGEDGNWTTLVTAVVEKVNVMEVVSCDRLVSRLATEHPREGYYPAVSFVGSQFQYLRIGGHAVTATLDLGLLTAKESRTAAAQRRLATAAGHEAEPGHIEFPDRPWPEVETFVAKAVAQAERIVHAPGAPEWMKARFRWMLSKEERAKKGYIVCSLVEEIQGTDPHNTFGHIVHVPGFGNVFLGELVVTPGSFHLNMLRIEMGCAADGNLCFGGARGNGFPCP